MTVAELIAALHEMPQDAPVVLQDADTGQYDYPVELVRLLDKEPDGCPHCNAELPVVLIE